MNIAVIFAGGSGQRMNTTSRPKQFLEMHKKPIIIYTLEIFENHPDIDAIVVACIEEWIPYLKELLYKYRINKVKKIVPGGSTGQMSIFNGLVAAKEVTDEAAKKEKSIVLIHDGVRPLIDEQVISDNIESVKSRGSAITSAKVTETIMVVRDDGPIDFIADRASSRVAKAPQSFWLDDVLGVHHKAQADGIRDSIDSCTLMKMYDYPLSWIDGPYDNIKITTPEDFYTMRALLDAKENAQIYID